MLLNIGKGMLTTYGDIDDNMILRMKEEGKLYKKSPFSTKAILKYFGTIEHFKGEIENGKNSKNNANI